jgi:hypothetical protein
MSWHCPKCGEDVDDDFDLCWSCGTSPDGTEDPGFVTADEADPIPHEGATDFPDDDPLADFGGTPLPDLVECYTAENTVEAKFVVDRLSEIGIPAVADKVDVNLLLGGWKPEMWGYGPRVRVRPEDLPRAQTWLKAYRERRKGRPE